jgi:hypothetical protein
MTFVAILSMAMVVGCAEQTGTPPSKPNNDSTGVTSEGMVRLGGEIISIPSPGMLTSLLQKEKVQFNATLINSLDKRGSYVNEISKALNLGVYGADLTYISNFDKGQLNNDYFEAVASIAKDLEVLDHIDRSIVNKISSSIGNRDSLISLHSAFYRAADKYLKDNQRSDLAGLILIGGWVEAMHLSMEAAKTSAEVRSRLGEQKYAAQSISNLAERMTDPSLNDLKSMLIKLTSTFGALQSEYKYQKPITDSKERITYLTSRSAIQVSDNQLAELGQQIETLRNRIVQ